VQGKATEGDFFSFSTDSGIVEHDVQGAPIHLAMEPNQTLLAMIVEDTATQTRRLTWWNPITQEYTDVSLPVDSLPGRMTWSADGTKLYVTDSNRSSFWTVGLGATLPNEISLPWPINDIAVLETETGTSVYVVPESNRELWVFDEAVGAFRDLNPETPESDGLTLNSFVRGIESIPIEYLFTEYSTEGIQRAGRSVAIALYSGPIVFLDEETGCLIQDTLGPRTVPNTEFGSNFDYGANFQVGTGPFLEPNGSNNRHVIVNSCSGIAKKEFWTVTFDENRQGWEVEGSTSGIQSQLAFEDTRYVSSDGGISFVVRSGATPSQDGQTFRFSIEDGALEANGDNNGDGQIADGEFNLSMPSDPVFFQYRVPAIGGGWQTVEENPMLLVASESANFVTRLNPSDAALEIIWE
jgi:hypothetical protein